MSHLTLEWRVLSQNLSQTLSPTENTKEPGSIRIGRDETKCDVVLKHPDTAIERTVSGLHAEIFFDPRSNQFCVRNLTRDRQPPSAANPVLVDGQTVIGQELPIHSGSHIQLGKMLLHVKTIEVELAQASASPSRPPQSRYALRCSNVRESHFFPMDYKKLTCEVCGRAILGATLIFEQE